MRGRANPGWDNETAGFADDSANADGERAVQQESAAVAPRSGGNGGGALFDILATAAEGQLRKEEQDGNAPARKEKRGRKPKASSETPRKDAAAILQAMNAPGQAAAAPILPKHNKRKRKAANEPKNPLGAFVCEFLHFVFCACMVIKRANLILFCCRFGSKSTRGRSWQMSLRITRALLLARLLPNAGVDGRRWTIGISSNTKIWQPLTRRGGLPNELNNIVLLFLKHISLNFPLLHTSAGTRENFRHSKLRPTTGQETTHPRISLFLPKNFLSVNPKSQWPQSQARVTSTRKDLRAPLRKFNNY
jgi:hypothetical protein